MHAAIYLEDIGGEVHAKFEFTNGYNANSPAHQVSLLIRQHLDQVMRPVPGSEETEIRGRVEPLALIR